MSSLHNLFSSPTSSQSVRCHPPHLTLEYHDATAHVLIQSFSQFICSIRVLYCFINITLKHKPVGTNSYTVTLKSQNICVKTHNYKGGIFSRQQLPSVHERNFGQNFRLNARAVIWLPITGILCSFRVAPRFVTRLTTVHCGA
jgi:hypothetical protein